MKRLFAFAGLAACAACAARRPPDAAVVDARDAKTPARSERASTEPANRFPAGPGVDFVKDDLEDALRVIDYREPYAKRLERARAHFGKDGAPLKDGVAWRGVGGKNPSGPFDCFELAVLQHAGGPQVVRVDRRLCGLPYRFDRDDVAMAMPFRGPGPSSTLLRVMRIVDDMKDFASGEDEGLARARLGEPDDAKANRWWAIGPRDTRGPISCHHLSFVDGRPHIEKKDLSDCGIAWPPPAKAFARDETIVPRRASAEAEECLAKCTASDVCSVRRVTSRGAAKIVERGDDVLAFELDGRPARIDVTTSCFPLPPACLAAPETMALCARPLLPPCVTSTEDSPSSHFGRAANGLWMQTCNLTKKKI